MSRSERLSPETGCPARLWIFSWLGQGPEQPHLALSSCSEWVLESVAPGGPFQPQLVYDSLILRRGPQEENVGMLYTIYSEMCSTEIPSGSCRTIQWVWWLTNLYNPLLSLPLWQFPLHFLRRFALNHELVSLLPLL